MMSFHALSLGLLPRVRQASRGIKDHLLFVAMLGLLGLSGCGSSSAARDPAGSEPNVRVARPIVREVTEYAFFTGRLDAVESVDIQARVTGYLQPIEFKSGAEVKAGQQLFLIDPRPYQATLDEASSQVKLAEARLQLAVADYQRALEVARTPGAISKQDVDKYAAAQSEAAASVQAAKANEEAAQLNLEFTSIVSPIDGRVGRNLLTQGNLVKQDNTLLTTVVSQDPMYAYFDVDEHTMLRVQQLIREGKMRSVRHGGQMPVQMGLANEGQEYPHTGTIDFVNNRVDPSTGTLQVRATFPNPLLGESETRLLSPGLFVRVRVPLGQPFEAILVPQAAVNTDQGLKYLLVVNPQGIVEYRPVTLGPEQPGGLQVVFPKKLARTEQGVRLADENTPADAPTFESIAPNEEVIVSGLQLVRPGMKVKTREVEITPGLVGDALGGATSTGAIAPTTVASPNSQAKPPTSGQSPPDEASPNVSKSPPGAATVPDGVFERGGTVEPIPPTLAPGEPGSSSASP